MTAPVLQAAAHRLLAAALALLMMVLACGPLPARAQDEPLRLNVGDVMQIVLPGEEGFNAPFKIDRDGKLELPEVGGVIVAGLTLPEAKERVRSVLSVSFRELSRFNLVLKEHRLLLSVLGFVKQPGPVDLPATANVQTAIVAAGGLMQGAQLDHMQVRRGAQVITFDFKKYLDSGDGKLLPALKPLDEIFVPASPLTGNVQIEFDARTLSNTGDAGEEHAAIRVFGEVNQPGSFAWRPKFTTVDALLRAGGVTRYASVEQIRLITGATPRLFNLKAYLDTGNQTLNEPLEPGTTIFVPKETEAVAAGPHVVYVMGEISKPGAYEAKPGTSFMDIIANAGGPTRFADTRNIRVLKNGGGVESFDLAKYTEGGARTALPVIDPGDAVLIPEKTQGNEQSSWLRTPTTRAVRVLGAVRTPGRYEWSDEMSLLDLIAQAGGPNDKGDLAAVQIVPGDAGGKTIRFDLRHFIEDGGTAGSVPKIHAGYTVMIPELPQSPSDSRSQWLRQPAETSIYVMGAVGHPGRYAFAEGLSFLDILTAADGPSPGADIIDISVAHRGESRNRVTRVNLAAYFESGDDTLLPHVRPGDVIFVPDRNRNWLEESPANTIRVLGAVGKPGRYRFHDGMSILDLLAEAGGPAKDALQEKIVVVNLSCCGNEARVFNLIDFAKKGDFHALPVVRAGDTVYVPSTDQSDWQIFMNGVRDGVSFLSIFALFKVLL